MMVLCNVLHLFSSRSCDSCTVLGKQLSAALSMVLFCLKNVEVPQEPRQIVTLSTRIVRRSQFLGLSLLMTMIESNAKMPTMI